jgi:hypothetical protein
MFPLSIIIVFFMKENFVRNIIIGFIAGVIALLALERAVYFFEHQSQNKKPKTDALAIYDSAVDLFLVSRAPFIPHPGVQQDLNENILYRYDPVIYLRDSTNFDTCFITTDLEAGAFKNKLGLQIFLEEKDRQKLQSTLLERENNNFVLNFGGQLLTTFYTDQSAPAKTSPDEADLTIIARERQILRLVQFAHSLTPGRKPRECSSNDDLTSIPHWDKLTEQFWE